MLLCKPKVNENGVGIICAKRFILNKSGHVVVVVPETETEKHLELMESDLSIAVASRNE
jgi:hypothetical protein